MAHIGKRLAALEQAQRPTGKRHMIGMWSNWDEELVLDHYGRDRIEPGDEILFVVCGKGVEGGPVYPAGYFDEGGRWAKLCAARGIPHRDNPPCAA